MHQHPIDIYLADLDSERSRDTMGKALEYFAKFITKDNEATAYSVCWRDIELPLIQQYKAYLQDKVSPHRPDSKMSANTISVYLSAIRGVLQKSHSNSSVSPEHKVSYEVLSEIASNLRNPKIDKSLKGQ